MYPEFAPATYDFGDPTDPQPPVISDGGVNSICMLSDLTLFQRISDGGASLLLWKTGRNSVVREVAFLRDPMKTNVTGEQSTTPMLLITGNGGGRFYNVWSVANQVVNGSGFRNVQVLNTTQPLAFYMLNCEYAHNNPMVELNNATGGVNIYQSKWEGNYQNLAIIGSNGVRVFGLGGNACAFSNDVADFVTANTDAVNFGLNYQIHVTNTAHFHIAGQAYQQRLPLPSFEGQAAGTYAGEWMTGSTPNFAKNDGVYGTVTGAGVNPSKFHRLRETFLGSPDVYTPGQEQFVLYKRGNPQPTIPD